LIAGGLVAGLVLPSVFGKRPRQGGEKVPIRPQSGLRLSPFRKLPLNLATGRINLRYSHASDQTALVGPEEETELLLRPIDQVAASPGEVALSARLMKARLAEI